MQFKLYVFTAHGGGKHQRVFDKDGLVFKRMPQERRRHIGRHLLFQADKFHQLRVPVTVAEQVEYAALVRIFSGCDYRV